MMDTTFTRAELRALAPADLRGLLEMADGETPWACAMSLGMDPTNPLDRKAVEAAVEDTDAVPTPFSPPIGATDSGVSLRLTPGLPDRPADPDGQDTGSSEALSLSEPDPGAASNMRTAMTISADTGSPFFAGTFALYGTRKGEVVLVTEDQAGEVKRTVVPRRAVQMALALVAGERTGVAGMIARKFSRG